MKSVITMLEPFKSQGSQSNISVDATQFSKILVPDKQPDPVTTVLIYGGKDAAVIIAYAIAIWIILAGVGQFTSGKGRK